MPIDFDHPAVRRAREYVLADYQQTWTSRGGVRYRKTEKQREIEHAEARAVCKILADYVFPEWGKNPDGMFIDLLIDLVKDKLIYATPAGYVSAYENNNPDWRTWPVRADPNR
jgi:hypothetical protein